MSLNEFLEFVCVSLLLLFAVKTNSHTDTFKGHSGNAPRSQTVQKSPHCHCVYIRRCPILRYRNDWRTAGDTCEFGYGEYRGVCCPSSSRDPKTEIKDKPSPRSTAPPTVIKMRPSPRIAEPTPGPLIDDNTIDCGHSRYTHGSDATEGSWPWMAAIKIREQSGMYVHLCSGFLIDRRHVISAAQCYGKKNLDHYRARIGSINQNEGDEYRIIEIDPHPRYTVRLFYDDIAILTLDREVNFPNFNPICLPDQNDNRMDLTGRRATLVGWGKDTSRRESIIYLKQLFGLQVVSNQQCELIFRKNLRVIFKHQFPSGINSGIICAVFKEGARDSCKGDDGAPLMILEGNRWFAVGIASFRYSCGHFGMPGGYTKVSNYLDWIRSKINFREILIEDADYAPRLKTKESSDCNCIYIRRCRVLRYRKDWRTAGETCEFGYGEYRRVCCPTQKQSSMTKETDYPSPRVTAPPIFITFRPPPRITEPTPGPIYDDEIECGHSIHTHGRDPAEGSWPWMVAIKMRKKSGIYALWCTGFLIDRRHVLSAAHCYEHRHLDHYRARIGSIYQNEGDEYQITRIVVHPRYTSGLFQDDIAILTLDREVNFPNYNPICLPDQHVSSLDLTSEGTWLVGWGTDKARGGYRAYLKQLVEMPVVPNQKCDRIYHETLGTTYHRQFPRGINSGFICAGFEDGGTDVCVGDDGAPLMIMDGDHWYAVGLSSFGLTCGHPGIPSGYTRISKYLDWIESETHYH